MEPLTTAAVAMGTVFTTKALEEAGKEVGKALIDQTGKFLESLKKQSPDIVTAIEKAPEQPLDYGQALLEVEEAAKENPEVAFAAQKLAETAEADPNQKLTEVLKDITDALKYPQPTVQYSAKLAEKIGMIVHGGTVNINEFKF